MALPPMGWKTDVFGEDFSFNCNAFDEPELMPEFGQEFPLPGNQTLKAGWIIRDGVLNRIVSCRKRTERDPITLFPTSLEWEAVDERGKRYTFKGRTIGNSDWTVQPNLRFVISFIRWECEGRVTYGELQEAHWTDYLKRFLPEVRRRSSAARGVTIPRSMRVGGPRPPHQSPEMNPC